MTTLNFIVARAKVLELESFHLRRANEQRSLCGVAVFTAPVDPMQLEPDNCCALCRTETARLSGRTQPYPIEWANGGGHV